MTIAGLACLLAVEASGCGNTGGGQVTSIRIGVSVYDQYDTFVSEMINHFNEYASEVSASMDSNVSVNIDVYNAAASQTTQNNQVKTMLEDGCDIICVNLVDRTEPVTIIDMAEKKDVPVIFFNRELVEQDLERWDKLYYVGAKAFESGIMQGEMAADIFKNDPAADKNGDGVFQYIVLEGEADHQDAIVRTEYAVSTITDQGVPVEKLGYAIANWNRAQANTKMSQLLTEYGDQIELVLSNNDDMALGAVDAMKAAGIDQAEWPVILGIDGTDVGLAALKNGEIRGTVYNDKEGQAEKMFDLAFCLARGLPLDDLGLEDGKYICGWAVEKMSKSMYNVVNPDMIVEKYGADTLRMYEMFLGPVEQSKPWDTNGIDGVHRFLKKLWNLFYSRTDEFLPVEGEPTKEELKAIHKLIKKVTGDIETFSYNTSISAFMICVNELTSLKCRNKEVLSNLIILLAPFAPHYAEELWEALGNTTSVCDAQWPAFNEDYLKEDTVKYTISFNGKARFTMDFAADADNNTIQTTVMADEQAQKWIEGKTPKKVIIVPKKIVNIVL